MSTNSNSTKKNSLRYQLATFRYAFSGLLWFFAFETKATIHIICAVLAVLAGFLLKISLTDWALIIIVIGFVLFAEILNTSIELMVDHIEKEQNKTAGRIKDLAAGAVLIAAISAFLIGIIVFVPRLFAMLRFIGQ